MKETIKLVGETPILGKLIKFYGTWQESYFLGKDVAEWIDYSKDSKGNYRLYKLLETVDEDEKCKFLVETCDTINSGVTSDVVLTNSGVTSKARKTQEMNFISEDGLYECLMQSRKPIAKSLKKEIKLHLKTIRKTGGTVEVGREEEFINTYFTSFSEEVKLGMIQDLMTKNSELKPKAEKFDEFMNSDGTYTTRNACKLLNLKERATFAWLREQGYLFKDKTLPTTKGTDKGYFKLIVKGVHDSMVITPLGIDFLRDSVPNDCKK